MHYNYIVLGAGIIGAATSLELIRRCPGARILLLEKEQSAACHQSGHNSGVVHAGVYYEPGSLKARFCREGVEATRSFCTEHQLPHKTTGKLIVATDEIEKQRLQALFGRCLENGLEPRMLDRGELREMEPEIDGLGAILVRESGITDYPSICKAMIHEFQQRGGEVRFGSEVRSIDEQAEQVVLHTPDKAFAGRFLIACGGLMADRLARMQGLDISFQTVPFRGEYFRLRPELNGLVRHLVYPVPDPALPFLGVHLTLMVDGSITVGPNAVQAWKREGYGRFNFNLRDSVQILAFPGWWRLTSKHLGQGLKETWNSTWKRAYLEQVRKYCPRLEVGDLLPHPAGIRAQALAKDGSMMHDFLLEHTKRSLHVCNAPSPAATSAIPVARHLCDLVQEVS